MVSKSSARWVVNCEAAATVAPITSVVEATIDQAAPRRGVRTRPTRFGVGGWRIFRQDLSDRGERYKSVIEVFGRAHVCTPVTWPSRMSTAACTKKDDYWT